MRGRAFKQSQRRRPDRDDSPTGGARRVKRVRRRDGYRTPLGMHPVRGRIFDLDRKERAGTDMQRDPMDTDAARP